MIGGMLVKLAFLSCIISIVSYYHHHRRGGDRSLRSGRVFFHTTVVAVMLASAYLLYLILTHQFQFTYVWSYSSTDLSLPLLISTFYAGQEGSFMLWTLYTSVIGVVLLAYSSRRGYEAQVMSVYGIIELMLLLMLIVKNPFTYVWETWASEVQTGFVPANGRGLNPLLQNYWMVIHPQVLFSGFAAMAVPYVYAVAGMMKREYSQWIRPATPWLVFGALVLGAGIMMGGFWAYETLGWGGYWGWDPVENSSLVPWLFSVATIHTVLAQRKSGALVRTNIVLSMLCFIFVLYSTFLTRSGVLGDTSVHSFVDPGMWAYWLLVAMITLFVTMGFGLFFRRVREMPRLPVRHSYWSREFAIVLGSFSLVTIAIFVTVGTSSPLITGILQGKTTAVDTSYYATTTAPLGIAIGLLIGVGQLLWWTRSNMREVLRSLRAPVGLSALLTGALVILGVRDLVAMLLIFGASFALLGNIQVALRILSGNPKYAGGAVAHIGVAVMMLGFVASSKYDAKETLSLVEGQPSEALGYRLTYAGYFPVENQKYAFRVHIEKDGRTRTVAPIMYYSEYTKGLVRNPDILNLITRDFYLAPLSLEDRSAQTAALSDKVELGKGETKSVGKLNITKDILVVEASVKPYINLVWSGVIILLVGFLVTIVRRIGDLASRSPFTSQET